MTKTKNGRFNRMIAILLMLIMVCSLLPTTVFADNTSQNVPDIGSDFYSDTVTTRLDDTVAVTADTYYQNAISTEVANPTLPTIVKQSQSTTTLLSECHLDGSRKSHVAHDRKAIAEYNYAL